MFGTKSGASDFEYKLGEVNVAKIWNPKELDPKKMGGFNFSTESKILRWLVRGDTIYDVELPEDAEVVDCPSNSAPHGVFRSNKIIISNPRTVTDDIAMELYLKSDLPEKSYYKAMAGCAVRGYMNTALKIFEDKVNKENVRLVTLEFEDFCKKNGLKSMYYRVGEDSLQRFESSKKQKLWLGQEAIVDVEKFNLQGKDKKSLRNGLNSLVKKGFVTEVLRAPQSEVILNELESISNEWLEEFNKSEIVFAEGKFDKDLLKYQDIIVVKNESGKIETFMNLIPDFSPSELTYDMIRRTKDAIGGSMDSVIVKLIEEAQARNIKFVNMGLTPLAGNDEPNNVAEKLIQIAYHRLESLKRYQTMRSFKEKYADIWENKYIVYGNEVELLQLPTALNKVMKPDVTKD